MPENILQYRTDNAFDTILLVRDGDVLSEWSVGPAEIKDFLNCAQSPDDWDDQGGTDLAPDDYGELLAYRNQHTLMPIDDIGWDARVSYFMRAVPENATGWGP